MKIIIEIELDANILELLKTEGGTVTLKLTPQDLSINIFHTEPKREVQLESPPRYAAGDFVVSALDGKIYKIIDRLPTTLMDYEYLIEMPSGVRQPLVESLIEGKANDERSSEKPSDIPEQLDD